MKLLKKKNYFQNFYKKKNIYIKSASPKIIKILNFLITVKISYFQKIIFLIKKKIFNYRKLMKKSVFVVEWFQKKVLKKD